MRTLLLSAVFTALVSLTAFAAPPSLVLVQYHVWDDLLTVTRGAGETKTIPLRTLNSRKSRVPNAEQLHALFAGLYAEGYELKNSTKYSNSSTETVTYIFVKP